jgi:hypothetical protein
MATTTKAIQDALSFELLVELVKALDATNWSSWQTTAPFDKELDAARKFLSGVRAHG